MKIGPRVTVMEVNLFLREIKSKLQEIGGKK
jgi:hypothetical protein